MKRKEKKTRKYIIQYLTTKMFRCAGMVCTNVSLLAYRVTEWIKWYPVVQNIVYLKVNNIDFSELCEVYDTFPFYYIFFSTFRRLLDIYNSN